MDKLKWEDIGYNHHRLTVKPYFFQITVGWEKDGFKVSFEDFSLLRRYNNLPDAKVAGVNLAKRVLGLSLASLEHIYSDQEKGEDENG